MISLNGDWLTMSIRRNGCAGRKGKPAPGALPGLVCWWPGDGGANEMFQPRKVPVQVRIAHFKKRRLFAAADSAAGGFSVFRVQAVGHVHACDDSSKRDEGFGIMRGGIVAQVDEHFRRPAIRHREGEGDGAALI